MGKINRISYRLVFGRKGLNMDGEGTIEIAAHQKGRKSPRYFSTGIRVKPEFWDDTNKRVKPSHRILIYNQRIREQLDAMEGYEISMINRLGSFSIDQLHDYSKGGIQVTNESFTAFFERELEAHPMKTQSKKPYQQTINKLKGFQKTIYFEDLNYKLVKDFHAFMHGQGIGKNSIKKHHSRVQQFIGYAIKEDLVKVDDDPYKKFEAKGTEPKRVFLIEEELRNIEQLEFEPKERYLERIRDIYLFQTYCVMRYQTVTEVAPKDVMYTDKGLALQFKAEKTEKTMSFMPLYALFGNDGGGESRPETILKKYLDQLGELAKVQPDIRLFKITEQYYNRQLKEIAKRAGITKHLTTHSARRTGSSILHKRGMPFKAVQKLMQHSTPTMTNIYIELSQQEIEKQLEKIQWK